RRSGKPPVWYLRIVSSPGDWIGNGRTYSYGRMNLKAHPNPRGVTVTVGDMNRNRDNNSWSLKFCASTPVLEVGMYEAKRLWTSGDAPGLEVLHDFRVFHCNLGKFRVWEITVADGRVTKLAIDFIQHVEGGPALCGSLRINSSFEAAVPVSTGNPGE